ncbi:5'-nucleotidase [Sinosporangium album]|uniref:5'-nucleotidase n=1 Tax=Sinosporangium album TaxID=504805 RepID=A0A1G7UJX0_9ACTN|nr:bifunctional metallophosphatase/5'-nucleotidase [Sinosporangium album]SDG47862.1 5'-nucleotidase [Sinosporangium album]
MTSRSLIRIILSGAVVASGFAVATAPADAGRTASRTVPVRLLSLNDFHGHLEPPTGSAGRMVDEHGATVDAGGAAYVAAHLDRLTNADTLKVAQGDLIGATPLISAAYHDEPSVEFLGKVGVTVSAVGNHEFDEGYDELKRIMYGGCHPVDGCSPAGRWQGAEYDYIGANVLFKQPSAAAERAALTQLQKAPAFKPDLVRRVLRDYGIPALPPVAVRWKNGVPIGFIGLVTKSTPSIVTSEGIKDLRFIDEVKAANVASRLLKLVGVKAQVVLVHEGDQVTPSQSPDACSAVPGEGNRIATQVDPEIDMVLSGHSHQAYLCNLPDPAGRDRLYSQGGSFGRVITQVDFRVDARSRDIVRTSVVADNHVVTRSVTPDPEIADFVQTWKERVAPVANRQVGSVSADITRVPVPSGETQLGNLIADAQFEAVKTGGNAEIALMNPGGVRADLTYAPDGVVTYGETFTVQPFNNLTQVVTLTGAQLDALLEQQFQVNRVLAPSASLTYTVSASAPVGSRVSNIAINGQPVAETRQVRVAANNFLIGGGDGFSVFTQGTDLWSGPLDIDALVDYLGARSPVAPPATDRITLVP